MENYTTTNTNTNKKEKGTSLDKIINSYTTNEELKGTLTEFLKMRKTIKKPMTDRAMSLLLSKLDKLGSADNEKIEILNQSILNCWQGIFELKDKKECVKNEYTSRNTFRNRGCFNEGTENFEYKPSCSGIREYTDEELEAAGLI